MTDWENTKEKILLGRSTQVCKSEKITKVEATLNLHI